MSLSSYRSEASYAHSHRKFGGNTSKQVKLLRKATNDYNRAVRRNKRNIIAADIAAEARCFVPVIGGVYHANVWGYWFTEGLPPTVTDRVTFATNNSQLF